MQYSEYTRRKLQSMQKITAAPTPLTSSTYIQAKARETITKCCPVPTIFPNITPCVTLPPEVGTASADDSLYGIKPARFYTNPCVNLVQGGPPQLAVPACCNPAPETHNTLWANNVPINPSEQEVAQVKICVTCPPPPYTGCDENGFGC